MQCLVVWWHACAGSRVELFQTVLQMQPESPAALASMETSPAPGTVPGSPEEGRRVAQRLNGLSTPHNPTGGTLAGPYGDGEGLGPANNSSREAAASSLLASWAADAPHAAPARLRSHAVPGSPSSGGSGGGTPVAGTPTLSRKRSLGTALEPTPAADPDNR